MILVILLFRASFANAYSISGQYLSEDNSYYSFDKFQGNLFIIDATASWCSGCEVQLEYLITLKKSAPDIQILSLSIDPEYDDISKMLKLKNDNGATWEFGIDENSDFQNQYPVSGLPSIFLFNEEGNLIKKWGSITPATEIAKAINEYRGGQNSIELADNNGNTQGEGLIGELVKNPMFQFFAIFGLLALVYFKITGNKEIPTEGTKK